MRTITLFLFWLDVRRKNKQLLKRLETADTTPYPPPTREELLAFIEKAEVNGINFHTRVQGLPRSPKQSAYVSIN